MFPFKEQPYLPRLEVCITDHFTMTLLHEKNKLILQLKHHG